MNGIINLKDYKIELLEDSIKDQKKLFKLLESSVQQKDLEIIILKDELRQIKNRSKMNMQGGGGY